MENISPQTPLFYLTLEQAESLIKSAVAEALKEQAEQRSIEPGKKYLTRSEASELLRISLVTLDKRIHDGTLTAKKIGNRYLISAESVDKALSGKLRRA
jgi:excisionase family DNA binding protein